MLAILIALPLALAAFAMLALRGSAKNTAKYIALAASIVTLALILLSSFNSSALQSITWFSFSNFQFALSTSTLPLNMILLYLVGIMTPLIIIYSIGYMDVPSEQSRFYFELCLFASAMLIFAMAGDFLTLFIGWEILGITSYLLIGFWYYKEGAADAARKAITTILIGDILMLIAIIIVWSTFGTFSFQAILLKSAGNSGAMEIALVLIMLAAFTKSAQFPFNEWLADAMKGPTPVSAFLHSSTMVKAGVFLIAVLLPLFIQYNLLYLLLAFGIITTIIGITNALSENNIKRILAYSTMEDLGLMLIALGTGSLVAAMILFVVQTFYKALLFMNSGAMIKANNNEEDITKMYNNASNLKLSIPTVMGVLSLAGLFPLSGFFGKTAIVASANSFLIYYILIAFSFLSSLYIFRWLFVPMKKKNEKRAETAKTGYKLIPRSMQISIYALAVLVCAASIIYFYLPSYLLGKSTVFAITELQIIISTAIVAIALIISYVLFYRKKYVSIDSRNPVHNIIYNNVLTNRAYSSFAHVFDLISKGIDEYDYTVYELIKQAAHSVVALGNILKKLDDGETSTYLAAFVIGFVIIILFLML
ncbi:MAG: proton-conducting transporter membrane subunit [Candidatus Micrarchaeaceae archaeon]|jgi:NADH-quinone oxidoreductase subunit L